MEEKSNKRKRGRNVTQRPDDFIQHCRPKGLCDLISSFSDLQKADVESIGFGGLLRLKVTKVGCSILLKWLVENFNGSSRMLTINSTNSFVITPNDVADVFQLPRYESTPVLTLKHNETAEIMAELKEQYGLENNTSISKLEELIKGRLSCGGDDFKRAFVLYCLSNFLTPTANSKVDFTAVKSLVNVGEIGYFDWSQYVLDKLCKAVSKYNKSTTQKNVSGCVLLLQILYFHRLKWRGIAQPSTLPLIQHWTHENLMQRMLEEISAGDFGQGELDSSTYPISSSKVATKIEDEVLRERSSSRGCGEINEESSRVIKFTIPKGELDNNEIHKLAKDEMHEAFLLLKRDMSVITSVHMERVMKLKEQMKGKAPESSTQCQLSQDSQLFFGDSKVLEYVDQVVENFLAMKRLSEAMPSFNLLTPDEENDDRMANIAAENDGDGGIEDHLGNIAVENDVDDGVDGDDGGWLIEDDCPFVSRFVNNNKQILSKLQIHELHLLDYCFVHDKSFIEDVSENVFAFDGEYFIPWNDIATLNNNEMICTTVIDGWCLLMNQTKDSMKCYFFGIGFSLYLKNIIENLGDEEKNERSIIGCWNRWMQSNNKDLNTVDLIFIPIYMDKHYFVVVINFGAKKVQCLDNRKHDQATSAKYIAAIKRLQLLMGKFLGSKSHRHAGDVLFFDIENVPFKWQTRRHDVDCGVYMMHHMRSFRGEVYHTPDLSKVAIRRELRAEICSVIIWSPLNELAEDVKKRVLEFCNKKSAQKKKNVREPRKKK